MSAGIPADLTTANDFVQVRLGLMQYLEDPLAAIVFTRIQYKTADDSRAWFEHDGRRWWTVTIAEFADEMGASEKQVRRVLDALDVRGAVRREQLRRGGPYDRRYSYSPVISEVPLRADRAPSGALVQAPSGADVEAPAGADVPLPENHEEPQEQAGAIHRAGMPASPHPHEPNACSALATLCRDRALPLSVADLLPHAYRLGNGDPWRGYIQVRWRTEQSLASALDPAAVLRKRLTT